jgi:hypothetical protein
MTQGRQRAPLILDANVVIDLIKLGVVVDVTRLPQYEFLVPTVVRAEIRRPEQAAALVSAIGGGAVGEVALDSIGEQALMASITHTIGTADAACLAAAAHRGGLVASDEQRGAFMRETRRLVGDHRLIRLQSLLTEAISAGLVTTQRLEGAVAALAATASCPRDRDDVEHLERVLIRVRALIHEKERG